MSWWWKFGPLPEPVPEPGTWKRAHESERRAAEQKLHELRRRLVHIEAEIIRHEHDQEPEQ